MQNNPLITIIVPIYNCEKYLKRCIESLLSQTYKNIEIILINDGSTDNSIKICEKYQKIDSRIIIINKDNEGVSEARNDGIKKANGEYISFVDSDDYLALDTIEILFRYIEKNNVDCTIVNAIDFDENGNFFEIDVINGLEILEKNDFLKELFLEKKVKSVCWGKLYKTSIAKKCVFNKKMKIAEDFDYLIQYIDYSSKFLILPYNKYYYYQRTGSAIHSGFKDSWFDEIALCDRLVEKFNNTKLKLYAIKRLIRICTDCCKNYKLDEKNYLKIRNTMKKYKKEYLFSLVINIKEKLKFILFLHFYKLYKQRKK